MSRIDQKIWANKYIPQTLDEFVFTNDQQRRLFTKWVEEKHVPNCLFSGDAGLGKTSAAKMLLKMIGVHAADVLEVSASNENGIDSIRDKIVNFASTMPMGDMRYIIFDEADRLSPAAMCALRNVIDDYSMACRMLFTCNYPEKIIPAIRSRCQEVKFESLDMDSFMARCLHVLLAENVEFEPDVFMVFVEAAYPSMRNAIQLLQQHVFSGVLEKPNTSSTGDSDWRIAAVQMFKDRDYLGARSLIAKQIRPEEMDSLWMLLYQNLHWWTDDPSVQQELVLILAEAVYRASFVALTELHVSATLIEMQMKVEELAA